MPADPPVPLTPEDRAILDLESDSVAGHTCKVVRLGDRLSAADLRAAVTERLPQAPELLYRLTESGEGPAWVADPGIDLNHHVTDSTGLSADRIEGVVAALFAQRLDRDRPLWRLDVVDDGGETALVWRIHHALADGMTAMRIAEAVLFDPPGGEVQPSGAKPRTGPPAPSPGHRGFLLREFGRSIRPGPFDGVAGSDRAVAFASVPLQPLHDAAKRLAGATLNDAVLVCVGGGVRSWLAEHHSAAGTLRIKVPVSLHSAGDEVRNRDSFFIVGVPLAAQEPAARLAAVSHETTLRKQRHDAEEMDSLLRHLGGVSAGLRKLVDRIERSGRAFALNVSNVPGPRRDLSVLGVPVASFHSLAEIAPHHSLRIAVVSAAGRLNFGVLADPGVVGDPGVIAAGIEDEAMKITAASR